MTNKLFTEVTKQVHILNDLILSDMICGKFDYSEEFITFSRQLVATKYWFLRIAWPNKRRYVLALLEDLRSTWALSLLLKSLWNCRPKDAVLSAANKAEPWSVYDVAPMDHNRTALPVSCLGQVMTNNRKWFHLLNPELQALVLSELLTIAGGPIMWEVLRRGQTIYTQHHDRQLSDLLDCIVVDQSNKDATKDATKESPSSEQKDKKIISIVPSEEELPHQSKNLYEKTLKPEMIAAQKNLEVSLNVWNNVIKGIRDSQKLEELEMTFKDGSVRKVWKVNRMKPEAIETVDFVQLLPSAVGKRILSYLPRATLQEYSKVNRYWAYLIEELKVELATSIKLCADKQKLKDMMLKHDVSMETIQTSVIYSAGGSMAPSADPSRRPPPSYRASEQRSTGGVSFRHFVVDKLKPAHKLKAKPVKRLADLTDRLYRRGAADENLFQWCGNALRYIKGRHPKSRAEEGVLVCGESHFPCPLMKYKVELPLSPPLSRDPALPVSLPKARRQFSYAPVNLKKPNDLQRYSLWSRDFSGLYKVFKVASYQYPTFNY